MSTVAWDWCQLPNLKKNTIACVSHRIYQGFIRLNLEKRNMMIIFDSLLTTFEESSLFRQLGR